MASYEKPLPTPDEASGPFWEGCRQGKLLIQRCLACGTFQSFPRFVCSNCLSDTLEWVQSSGKATVHTYSTIYRPPAMEFGADLPYTVAIVHLQEGVPLMTNVVGCEPEEISIDMPVEVVFDHVTPEVTLPKFKPVARSN